MTEQKPDWKNIVNLESVELKPDRSVEKFHYEYAQLSTRMGAKKLGYNITTLPPGQFSCPYHFHHSEEELFLILEGKAMLRQANQFREVAKGDLIFFENSAEGAHQFYNHTDQTCRFLALSTKDEMEIAEYPDSNKIMVAKLRKVFQRGTEVDYWKDEADPAPYWPKELLRTQS